MKHIYLIQTNKPNISYNIPPGSDRLIMQWQEKFKPCKDSFHFPNSTWASGRNELYARACRRLDYDYFIFLDDDLSFDFDLKDFEKLLEKINPRRAVPWMTGHPF